MSGDVVMLPAPAKANKVTREAVDDAHLHVGYIKAIADLMASAPAESLLGNTIHQASVAILCHADKATAALLRAARSRG